ncbi:MAG TPA: exodeoxyribonuclease I [Candidatus Saccharimonadales bacterium]|jgi:exodeoxyribonuclease-1|nr:exodeoxyribonuclease I [Candidatus Saccharimonadales bacterium]
MAAGFFFYDLETSGFSPRTARVVQFAGQRTDMDLKPLGEPVNVLIKLTSDVIPDPDAVLITGITPQKTLAEGLTEAEFLRLFYEEVVKPDTIFIGYNSIRFDDEFMRFLHYRNFYDAYEWQWKDGNSRWDLLDVVRMTRALRPEGIQWPFAPDGKPTNRLEFLTKLNKLDHFSAHDALSDVQATMAMARLIKTKQPELFAYLFNHRGKKAVQELVQKGAPFVYTTGRYSSQWLHTSVAVQIAKHVKQDAALVYDLRYDPTPFLNMLTDELIEAWRYTKDPDALRLPVKTIKFNRSPAVAPLGVIKAAATQERLQISLEEVTKHLELLKKHQIEFASKLAEAVEKMDKERQRSQLGIIDNELTVDERLYDGFIDKADAAVMAIVRGTEPAKLNDLAANLHDARLKSLLPLYKARNFPKSLSPEEQASWDEFIAKKLFAGGNDSRFAKYFGRLQELAQGKLSGDKQYLLEELRLYGESIMPTEVEHQR